MFVGVVVVVERGEERRRRDCEEKERRMVGLVVGMAGPGTSLSIDPSILDDHMG